MSEFRDLTGEIDTTTLLTLRQHAVDLALQYPNRSVGNENDTQRRARITQDADAWCRFVLAAEIAGRGGRNDGGTGKPGA